MGLLPAAKARLGSAVAPTDRCELGYWQVA